VSINKSKSPRKKQPALWRAQLFFYVRRSRSFIFIIARSGEPRTREKSSPNDVISPHFYPHASAYIMCIYNREVLLLLDVAIFYAR
jgi:hypothetical protein